VFKLKLHQKIKSLPIILFISFVVSVIIHNILYAILGFEEPLFFSLALISVVGLVLSTIHNFLHLACSLINKKISIPLKKHTTFTRRLFFYSAVFNLIASLLLILGHQQLTPLIAPISFIPPLFFVSTGVFVFAFTAWQVYVIKTNSLKRKQLIFASWMALIPAIILLAALFVALFPIYLYTKTTLLIYALYLITTGLVYLSLSQKLKH